ncbi:hypothetical protein CR513_24750, partial [Mucuna pruriens]
MQWMATLPLRSIQTFKDLASSFLSQFAANKVKRLEVVDLFDIKQGKGESLKKYLARFNNAIIRVDDPDQKFFVKAFQKGLRAGPFSDALALRKPTNMEEIRARAEKHVEMEEDQYERRRSERKAEQKATKMSSKVKEDKRPMLVKPREQTQHFTPFNEKRTQIMHEICHTSLLEYPPEAREKVMGKRGTASVISTGLIISAAIETRKGFTSFGRDESKREEQIASEDTRPQGNHKHHFGREDNKFLGRSKPGWHRRASRSGTDNIDGSQRDPPWRKGVEARHHV